MNENKILIFCLLKEKEKIDRIYEKDYCLLIIIYYDLIVLLKVSSKFG